ncbi:phage capsid protein [Clostridium botulinum]|uniref:Major capsid protein n=1 Tax=Clostridium botulinum TaxID=1491 RepID=A0ABD7CFK0_CLOBO|nr:major capsid protein [Clostridium botulinum]KGO14579.1 phage capsid protein [Clostridium botulinum]QRI52132.1 major capsid protein [Clostridium botulinum]
MPNLRDYINSKNIALYIKELPVEQTIDKALFPDKKVSGTKLEMAKGAKKKPIALRMSTFDANTKMRALSADLNVKSTEIPFFKEGMGIDETTRRDLQNAIGANNENFVNALLGQVFENYSNLIDGANIISKKMRSSVIQNGLLNFTSKDGDIVVEYGVQANHREVLTGVDKWTNPDADIIGDIKVWQKAITNDQYAKPKTLLLTENTFDSTFLVNKAITNHIKNSNLNTSLILSQANYIQFVKEVLQLTVVFLEDATYIPSEGADPVPYYVDGKVTLMSGTTLGNTVYGTTPEEFDKQSGSSKLDTYMVDTGIAVTTMIKEDPVTVDTKVSVMPIVSFDRADEVFFATVY